ncbi:MAG: hypothetical protein K9J30_05150 [Bacteroidales bacterium]|nr:hypothetical protein [Bacteroidales bacterium]
MPYRRLPNTDNARIRAIKRAHEKGTELPPFKLAFSQSMYQKIKTLLPSFENSIIEYRNALNIHAEKNKDYQLLLKKAKLYISHFIQVIDMAITRGELSPDIRSYYKLNDKERKLPGLTSEEDIIIWGTNLMEGERERKLKGLAPITNPTIAVVRVHFEKFVEAYNHQQSIKKRANKSHQNLEKIRENADEIIQQTWNQIEDTFKDLPEDIRRKKSADYGVVYIFRKNELDESDYFQPNRIEESGYL